MIEYLRTHLTAVSVNDALHILNRLSFLAISSELNIYQYIIL